MELQRYEVIGRIMNENDDRNNNIPVHDLWSSHSEEAEMMKLERRTPEG